MLRRLILIVVCWWLIAMAADAVRAAEAEIVMDRLPLWFVDDSGVASRSDIYRMVHTGRTLDQPVIEPERPWEGGRLYLYGSVYSDPTTNELRMWYMSCSDATQGSDQVLVANSKDGVRWEKPNLGIVEFAGSRENNIVFDLHSPSVLFDLWETDPGRRYKMVGSPKGKKSIPKGYAAAYSADGLRWTYYSKNPIASSSDTITLTQHPSTGEYLAYHKRPTMQGKYRRRVVWLTRSSDFNTWSEPELVLSPDGQDDAWVKRESQRSEIYNLSVFPHAAGFLGLPTMFRVMTERSRDSVEAGQSPLDGPIDVQLVTSVDGTNWQRSLPRVNVIPRGAPGTFDGGAILGVSSTPVHVGDKTWVYYTAINTGHGGTLPTKRLTIGRAEWRRDGFVSFDADPMGGRLETKPLRFKKDTLFINADAARGEVRLALLEADGNAIAGYSLEDCHPMRLNSTRWAARWDERTVVPTDRAVRVVIEMKGTSLYSLASGSERQK